MPFQAQPAVFLDRDGVLIENVSTYVRTWDEVHIFPFTQKSLEKLKSLGLPVFVITNQALIGKGVISLNEAQLLHNRIIESVDPHHAILKSYLCPHRSEDNCLCRKPLPGSLIAAAKEFNIDLSRSFMVGDGISDVEAGLNAGTKAILVRTGRGEEESKRLENKNVPVVANLAEAVDYIESITNADQK